MVAANWKAASMPEMLANLLWLLEIKFEERLWLKIVSP